MEQAGLQPADLNPYIQSKSKVSEVMNRKRPLSLSMIRALHRGLNIPAEVLVQETGATGQKRRREKTQPDTGVRYKRSANPGRNARS
jgi:HTH-type transcriptional regulator/antitoxin HigA